MLKNSEVVWTPGRNVAKVGISVALAGVRRCSVSSPRLCLIMFESGKLVVLRQAITVVCGFTALFICKHVTRYFNIVVEVRTGKCRDRFLERFESR